MEDWQLLFLWLLQPSGMIPQQQCGSCAAVVGQWQQLQQTQELHMVEERIIPWSGNKISYCHANAAQHKRNQAFAFLMFLISGITIAASTPLPI